MRSSGIDSLAADNIIESAAKMSTKVYSSIRVLISIDFTALSITLFAKVFHMWPTTYGKT